MSSVEIYQRAFRFKQAKRRRRDYEKIQIPNDVVEEILLRLPVKPLIRFQSVSKQWRCWIESRDFWERYISHQKTKHSKLLLVCELLNRSLSLETLALETTSASPEDSQCVKFEKVKGFLEISESCDGLVCIYALTKAVWVLNPATSVYEEAKIQRLCTDHPDLEAELAQAQDPRLLVPVPLATFTRFGFGKDCLTGRYKLVWLYNKYPATSLKKKKKKKRPAFANGSFYWLTGDEQGDPSTQTKLVVFDLHTEMFQVTATPSFITCDAFGDKIGLCNLDGRLCISELKGDCKQEFWWRVKDNNTWEKIFSVDLRSTSTWFGGITSQPLTPLAISRDNNKVEQV